jgi:Tol biopolymer transport system component
MKTTKAGLFLLVFLSGYLSAQTITVSNRYEMSGNSNGFYPTFNINGDKLLFSSDSYNGLSMYDLNTKAVKVINNDPGAGYEPMFDAQDSKVFYRKTTFDNGRRMDAVESFELSSNKKTQMLSPQRDLKQARNFHNGFIVTANRKLLKSTFGQTSKALPVYVTTQDLKIYLYKDAKFQILNPLNEPESRYLWVSLSPSGKMILFTAAGKGTYVCDLSGKIVAALGYLNAPVWYDDNFVVGMQDKDDGHVTTASKIIIMSINGKSKTQVSTTDEIAMYPTSSAKSSKIAYNTIDGKIQIVEIGIK